MIVDKNGEISIIDFNRWGYADPFEEFNRLMVFTREKSIPFAKEQIYGYFDGEEPQRCFLDEWHYTRQLMLCLALCGQFLLARKK